MRVGDGVNATDREAVILTYLDRQTDRPTYILRQTKTNLPVMLKH